MSEAENPPVYTLRVINAKTVGSTASILKEAPSLYVKICLLDSHFEKKTKIIKKSYDPVWDESFTITGVKDMSLEIQFDLKHESVFRKFNKLYFGTIKISIDQLISQCRDNSCSLDLRTVDEADPRSKLGWSLEVQLTSDSIQDLEAAKTFISGLQENPHFAQIAGPSSHIAQAVEGVAAAIESQTPLQKALETLLSKLSTVQSLVAVIHPYVNAAWQIVSAMYRVSRSKLM
ncbi:hypothetical protein B0H21DRAFT_751120 [Amylocystis lapponica]|nr:hypothetical protein B0H21DRAFT_751120 [Amylocystis lapponica]